MSGVELSMLYASILESKRVPICGKWKSSLYGRMGGSVCTRACVRFFRESIIVIASCHGTVRNSKTTINRFFSYPVVARVSRCVAVVLLFEEVDRRRWVAGLAELSTYLPRWHITYFYFLALLRIVLASPLIWPLASPELVRPVMI